MKYYRITKYNPIFRHENGSYLNDEWVDSSCIGNVYNGEIFTAAEYLDMEEKYWLTIKYLLDLCGVNSLDTANIELHTGLPCIFSKDKWFDPRKLLKSMRRRLPLGLPEIELASRLMLRNIFWCQLVRGNTYIHFGYDYYVYFGTDIPHEIDSSKIPEGIYIDEDFKSPYLPEEEEVEWDGPVEPGPTQEEINQKYLGADSAEDDDDDDDERRMIMKIIK